MTTGICCALSCPRDPSWGDRPPAGGGSSTAFSICCALAAPGWRLLPREYGPWSTIYGVFRLWVKQGIWERVHNAVRTKIRAADGRQPSPTAAILDSQTVKVGDQGGVRGYDAGKKPSAPLT